MKTGALAYAALTTNGPVVVLDEGPNRMEAQARSFEGKTGC